MKKIKHKYILFFFIISLIFVTIVLGEAFSKTGEYNFPVKPGTEAWKQLQTHDEMIAVSQVPDDILSEMTTEELVETCLRYPLLGDFMYYNDKQKGIEAVIKNSNCLQQLLNRENSGEYLLSQYSKTRDIISYAASSRNTRIEYFRHSFIEMLLAQKSIRDTLTPDENKSLLKNSLDIVRIRQNNPDLFSFSSLEPALLIMKRIVEEENRYTTQKGEDVSIDEEVNLYNIEEIITQAKQLISE